MTEYESDDPLPAHIRCQHPVDTRGSDIRQAVELTIGIVLCLAALCFYFGRAQGLSDALEIERRLLQVKPEDLDHGALLIFRVIVCGGLVGVAMIVETWGQDWTGWTILDCIYMAGVAFGSFTPVHRYTLNKARGLAASYISKSNGYDSFWLYIASLPTAGTLAYAFEFAVLLASTILLILTNT